MNTNLLQAVMTGELAQRDVVRAVREDEAAEFKRIVSAIHAAFEPFAEQVQKLVLIGDYGHPVVLGARGEYMSKVVTERGLEIHLGSKISSEELNLVVVSRKDAEPATIRLYISRHYPYKSSEAEVFPGDTAAQHVIKRFFELLMPHLHANNFATAAKA